MVVSFKDQGYDIVQTGSCQCSEDVHSSHLSYCMVFLAIGH